MNLRSQWTQRIDRVVRALAPQSALKRELSRQKLEAMDRHAFRYEGAMTTRARGAASQTTLQSPESGTYAMDRVTLMRGARELAENGEICAGVLGKFQTYVAGKLRYQARTGQAEVDAQYEAYMDRWFAQCHATGQHSFRKLMQLAVRHALMDGDAGLELQMTSDGQLRLAGVEGDRLGSPYAVTPTATDFNGVLVDKGGRPVAYRVFQRTIYGAYENPREVPAEQFLHLMNPVRFDQYRGVTAFHAVLNVARDVKEIIEFEKLAVKWGSAQSAVVTESSPETANMFTSGTDLNGNPVRVEEIQPGRINYVSTSGAFQQFTTNRPGATWTGFLQLLVRLYALGVNLPYGYVFDMSTLGGPAARFESEQAKRTFQDWQDLLREKVLSVIQPKVLALGIARGDIPATPNWERGVWQFPAHPTIDIGRESQANLNENRQGIRSMATILGEEGLDDAEEREQIAKECSDWLRLSKEYDVPVEMMRLATPNPPTQPAEEAGKKPERVEKEP